MRDRPRPEREHKVTLYLRGDVVLRFDAVAVYLWERGGRAAKTPSQSLAIYQLLLEPDLARVAVVRPHRCRRCDAVFGAPWCWEHGAEYIEPC